MFVVFIEMALTAVSWGLHIYLTCFLLLLAALLPVAYRWLRFTRHGRFQVIEFLRGGNRPRNSTIIVAHRGGSDEAPENTIAAFRRAKDNGAVGVEFDLDFSKDGVPVIIHDSTVDRTTNGTGCVNELTFEELRRLDASLKHPLSSEFPNERIPTLEEAVETCVNLGLQMYIDVKAATHGLLAARSLKDVFTRHQLYDKAIVCSFYPNVIFQVRRLDPNILTALIWRKHFIALESVYGPSRYKEWWKQAVTPILDRIHEIHLHSWVYDFLGVDVISCQKDSVSRNYVKDWNDKGLEVIVWTVNDPSEKEYFGGALKCPVLTDKVLEDSATSSE